MSALTVELPGHLAEKVRQAAAAKNLTMDALPAMALAQSFSRLIADSYPEQCSERSTDKGLEELLAQAPNIEPPGDDRLPEGCRPKKE